jgi:hypothetical protein
MYLLLTWHFVQSGQECDIVINELCKFVSVSANQGVSRLVFFFTACDTQSFIVDVADCV